MRRQALALVCACAVAGCAEVPKDAGFDQVVTMVSERVGHEVRWTRASAEDEAAAAAVDRLLADELEPGEAVQIALLNNRDLQATYERLMIAQADLVAAGLLRNPIFDAEVRFAESAGTGVELSVLQEFLGVFQIPLRKRIAGAAFEAAKLEVAEAAIDLAGEVRAAYCEHQAAMQRLELRGTVLEALEASVELASRLREAGNITARALAMERAQLESAKIEAAIAETESVQTRERLNVLMGLWGPRTDWTIAARLPDVPDSTEAVFDDLEAAAVERSLALASMRASLAGLSSGLELERTMGLLPEFQAGAAADREAEDGEWAIGPAISLPIPIFDQNQAAIAAAAARGRAADEHYAAAAIELRSAARAARLRLLNAHRQALHYRTTLLPLHQELVELTQLEYNAMQIGAFELLQARRAQIETGVAYIDALLEYWLARIEVEAMLAGGSSDIRRSSVAGDRPRMGTPTEGISGGHD